MTEYWDQRCPVGHVPYILLVGEISKGMLYVDRSTSGCVSGQRGKRWLCGLLGLCLNFFGDKYLFHYKAELGVRGVFPVMQWFIAHAILSCFSPLVGALWLFSNDLPEYLC